MTERLKWNLIAVFERLDGTIFKQRIAKVDEDISPEEVHKLIKGYKKILGDSYFTIDWYLSL